MLNKSRKGQILKKVNIDESFARDNRFYLPISLSTSASETFNVKKLMLTFIPDVFIEDTSQSLSLNPNKPYHIKDSVKKNKQSYRNNEIKSEKNSSIFRSIYAKNIVNTKDQSTFKENVFNVNIPLTEGDIFEVITSTPLNLIKESTTSYITLFQNEEENVSDTRLGELEERAVLNNDLNPFVNQETAFERETQNFNQSQLGSSLSRETTTTLDTSVIEELQSTGLPIIEYNNFVIRVYALNQNDEILDDISISSNSLQEYLDDEASLTQRNSLNVLTSRINNVLNSFRLNLYPFRFSANNDVEENLEILGDSGSKIEISENSVSGVLDIQESEGLFLDFNFFLTEDIEDENAKSLSLFTIGSATIDESYEIVREIKENFRLNCLKNKDYVDIITSLYTKCISESLNEVKIYYRVEFTSNSEQDFFESEKTVISKESTFSLENLTTAYNDIKRFNLISDIKNKIVLVSSLENLRENNKYKVSLLFNTADYENQLIYKNRLSFDFQDNDGQSISPPITDFYFDENFSKENYVKISLQSAIENYIEEGSSSIDFYFNSRSESAIQQFFVNFKIIEFDEEIKIGPFALGGEIDDHDFSENSDIASDKNTQWANMTFLSIEENESDNSNAARALSFDALDDQQKRIRISNFNKLNDILRGLSAEQKFKFEARNFIDSNTTTIEELGYSANLTSDDVNNVLQGFVIKNTKSLNVNNIEVFNTSFYGFLNDIPISNRQGDVNNDRIKTYNITNYNSVSSLVNPRNFDDNSVIKRDLDFIRGENYDNISSDFRASLRRSTSLFLLPKVVVECLGSPEGKSEGQIFESKNAFVKFILKFNPNYNASDLTNLINLSYSSSYNNNREIFSEMFVNILYPRSVPVNENKIISMQKVDFGRLDMIILGI